MAPEMVKGERFGAVADVWSLGLVIAQILGLSDGRRFKGNSVAEVSAEHDAVVGLPYSINEMEKIGPMYAYLLTWVSSSLCLQAQIC